MAVLPQGESQSAAGFGTENCPNGSRFPEAAD